LGTCSSPPPEWFHPIAILSKTSTHSEKTEMPSGDEITVRQMLELVIQKFEQQEKTLGRVEGRLDKLEETVLSLRTGDIQQIKLELNDLTHRTKDPQVANDLSRIASAVESNSNRLAKMEGEHLAALDQRLRNVEALKPTVDLVPVNISRITILENKHVELEGAKKALSPFAKVLLGVVTALLIAVLVAWIGIK